MFSAYVAGVYTNRFPERLLYVGGTCCLELPIDVYILADRVQDLKTANMAIDYIMETSDPESYCPTGTHVATVYGKTPQGNPLRKLMIDYMVHEAPASTDLDEAPHEFLLDVFREASRVHDNACDSNSTDELRKQATERPRCHYHQHDNNYPQAECEGQKG